MGVVRWQSVEENQNKNRAKQKRHQERSIGVIEDCNINTQNSQIIAREPMNHEIIPLVHFAYILTWNKQS